MTTVVVLQPGYLPWLGFFDQLERSDVFVFYDDVQYDKNGWRNRNRVKGADGEPLWLTVPVLTKGRFGALVRDVEIDGTQHWARAHVRTLRQLYGREERFEEEFAPIAAAIERGHRRLLDLDLELTAVIAGRVGIARRTVLSSELGVKGERSEKLVEICRRFGAKRYLSGDSAESYLDRAAFAAAGIEVEFQRYVHPVYEQGPGTFVPCLSIVDLLFRRGGAESLRILGSRRGSTSPEGSASTFVAKPA